MVSISKQLIYWPMDFVNGLVKEGFRVVTFDNRDVGLSYKFDGVRPPHPLRQMLTKRLFPKRQMAPYNLSDMARDAVGVLDALKIDRAHIVGASMGGMIGQLIAGDHADRVLSFTPVMSSTNGPGLPGANAEVQERGFYPPGPKRQMAAIIDTGNLRPTANRITAPTMVIHGADDPLIPSVCGQDIAANVKGARFELVEGMGHDLPPSKLPKMVDLIAAHCRAA